MKITDKKVLQWIKALDILPFTEDIEEYPEDERDGRSDIEFFTDELSYFISLCEEDEHTWNDELKDARRILRETKNGRVIPVDPQTFQPKYGYRELDIERAKQTVSEYSRMKYRYKKLNELGYYGYWL